MRTFVILIFVCLAAPMLAQVVDFEGEHAKREVV
jgi:hypothetical protein